MIRLENLELEHREEGQRELQALADALEARGVQVEVSGVDDSFRGRLQESVGGDSVDVVNVIIDASVSIGVNIISSVIYDWAKRRRRFRGEQPGDRPQARLWIVEDGREYDYAIDLDPRDDDE